MSWWSFPVGLWPVLHCQTVYISGKVLKRVRGLAGTWLTCVANPELHVGNLGPMEPLYGANISSVTARAHAEHGVREAVAGRLLHFWRFFAARAGATAAGALSVRDLLAWARFVNAAAASIGALPAYAHGAHLVLLDGLGLGAGVPSEVPLWLAPILATYSVHTANPHGHERWHSLVMKLTFSTAETLCRGTKASALCRVFALSTFANFLQETHVC